MLWDHFNVRTNRRAAVRIAVAVWVLLAFGAVASPAEARIRDLSNAGAKSVWGPTQLVVYKSKRMLVLYHHGRFTKRYDVVLGLKPDGRKRFAYDARTPEGYYRITDKYQHQRWGYFLSINYPNAHDRLIYNEEVEAGIIPTEKGQPFPIGGGLGLHGNDKPDAQNSGSDWTLGCVAMYNDDITELFNIVKVGTPIWLLP